MRHIFDRFNLVRDESYRLEIGALAQIRRVTLNQIALTRHAPLWTPADFAHHGLNVGGDTTVLFAVAFDESDNHSANWAPQGVSASWDAEEEEQIDGRRWLAVTWHGPSLPDILPDTLATTVPHARISLMDVTNLEDVRYRHVLLIEAHDGDNFRAVETHAGGCVWYGRWLYVADNARLLVFDMSHIMDIAELNPGYDTSMLVGMLDGVPHGGGYRYLLPLARRYEFRSDSPTRQWPTNGGPFDSLGLDRTTTPHRLIAGSFIIPAPYDPCDPCRYDCDPTHNVVMTWDLDADNGTLRSLEAEAFELFDGRGRPELYVQGILGLDGDMWVVKSLGDDEHALHRHQHYRAEPDPYAWPSYGEGITFHRGSNTLWCVKEYPKRDRCVFVTGVPTRTRHASTRILENGIWSRISRSVPPLTG